MKNLKKLLFSILIISCFTFVVPILFTNIPTSSSYSVQAVKLNTSKKTLVAGSKYTLKVKGTSKKVKWSTSNKKVAKVSSKGKVTAVKKGTAYITAKVGSRKYVCKITVKSAPSLSYRSKTLIKGTTFTLKMKNTTKKVKWSTSNKKIAKVNSKGKVTAVKTGTTYIKAKVSGKTYSCKIRVESPSLSSKKCTIIKGTTYSLKVKGNSQPITWSSSNKKIAKVSSKGKITGVKKGTATIYAKIAGKKYSCKVTVQAPHFSNSSITVKTSSTYQYKLKGVSLPTTYTCSDTSIARVNKNNGTIYGIKEGSAKITAKVSGKKYSYTIKIKKVDTVSRMENIIWI